MVCWISPIQVKWSTKPIEIPLDTIPVWIASIQSKAGRKLCLSDDLQWERQGRSEDLGTFGIEVSAESLEVGAKQHYEATQILLTEARIWRGERQRCGKLRIDLLQAEHPVNAPQLEGYGGHAPFLNVERIFELVANR
jgi:hypothetical protein